MKKTIRLIFILFITLSTLKSYAQSEVEKLAYSKFIGGFDIDLLFVSNDTISGDFLVKLILTDSLNNKSNKLSLKNAIVAGRVDLASKKIDKEISFYNVQFINEVNFENATVENDLTLKSCEFNKINISEGTILGHLILDYSKFVQKVDFHLIQVKRNFLLRHTNFYSEVDLGSAIVGNFLVFNSAKFHTKSRLNLNSSKVGTSLQLKSVIFDCPVNGSYMEIGSNFDANNCKFQSTESVVFQDLKVNGWLELTNSYFNGIFDLKYSKIESDVNFKNSSFNSELDFYYATFGLGRFQNVQFNSDSALIDFKNVNITSDLNFSKAVFNSHLRLSNANIGGNLYLWLCHNK